MDTSPGHEGSSAVRAWVLLVVATLLLCRCQIDVGDELWRYVIQPSGDGEELCLEVVAHFTPPVRELVLLERRAAPFLTVEGGSRRTEDGRVILDQAAPQVTYRVALGSMARAVRDHEVARLTGDAIVGAWTSWLLRPPGDRSSATVLVETPGASEPRVWLALPRVSGCWRATGRQTRQDLVSVAGSFRVVSVQVPGHPSLCLDEDARVDVVVAGGEFTHPEAVQTWVEQALQIVAGQHGGLAVSHCMLALLPVPRRGQVLFGRVLPGRSPTVMVWVGAEVRAPALYDDWVLVHELIHLAFAPVRPEGRWLDEGASTYLEPLLRARAGWIPETELWRHFVSQMPRGLRSMERQGLANARGIDARYWGGALFCFLYDLEMRRMSEGRRGFEDALADCVRRGFTVTGSVRSLDELIDALDEGAGHPVGQRLADRHVEAAAPVGLDQLWRDLGVIELDGAIHLDETAPEAWLRRALARGSNLPEAGSAREAASGAAAGSPRQ